FIYESKNVMLEDVQIHYMHGLGIVSQYTRNVTMRRVKCVPSDTSGRILASSADFMHFSGCSGKVTIQECTFSGAHDDPINVHGTNLRAVDKIDDHTLELRFMHGQSYGFNAYFDGDTVAFVRPSTMERYPSAVVTDVKKISERVVRVSFDRNVPSNLELGHDCVENMTCTPEVEILGCYFTHTNTRGTLVTTPRRVVIEGNTYYKTGMSAILIEGDAEGWFESGPVCDVLIKQNRFVDCAYQGGPAGAVIALNPSNTMVDTRYPVHRNVRIVDNTFQCSGNPALYAKSTNGLTFTGNKVEDLSQQMGPETPFCIFNGCGRVKVRDNEWPSFVSWKNFRWENMPKKELKAVF
ncbi:MAG: right-handed parallel beta-helix repeat-containing protein, partial [Bacteroidaceae bacterium]